MQKGLGFKRTPGKGKGVAYVALFWTALALFVFGAFFETRIALFSDHPTSPMNMAEFYTTFAATVVCAISFLLLAHRNFRIGIAWGWLILFLILFAANSVGLFTFETHFAGTSTYKGDPFNYDITFTIAQRIEYLCCFFVACLFFYIFFAVLPKTMHNIRRLHLIWWLFVLIAFASIVYSLIAEWPLYQQSFTPGGHWTMINCNSFTNNPNTFALLILSGIVCLCFLHNRRSHWYLLALILFLGLFQILLGSGSGAIGSWVIIFLYLIYRFRITLWSYTGRNIGMMLLFLAIAITFSILVFAQVGGEGSIFYKIGRVLKRDHFSTTSGALRLVTWQRIFDTLNTPLKWIFGIGDTQAYYYLGAIEYPAEMTDVAFAHNGFFHQLLSGGLIRFAIYIGLLGRFVYLCFRGFRNKRHVGMVALIAMAGVVVRSCLETTSFLQLDGKGVGFLFTLILPVEVDSFLTKHPEIEGYEEAALGDLEKTKLPVKQSPLRLAKLCFLFLTPLTAIMLSATPVLLGARQIGYYVMWGGAFLLMPFAYYCIGHHADPNDRGIFGFLLTVGFVASLAAGTVLKMFLPFAGFIGFGAVALLTLITFLCHAKSVFSFREKLFLKAYLPHVLLCGVLAGLGCLLYLIPAEFSSIYNPIMAMIFIIGAYFCVLHTSFGEKMAFPWFDRMLAFDCHRTALGIVKERKLNEAQEAYLYKGINRTPPKPKKLDIRL